MTIEGFEKYAISKKGWEIKEDVANYILELPASMHGKAIGKVFGISDIDVRGIVNWFDCFACLRTIASGPKGYIGSDDPDVIQATINQNEQRIKGIQRKLVGLRVSRDRNIVRLNGNDQGELL